MSNIPAFETGRLILRDITEEDAPAYQKHFADYNVIGHLTRAAVPWPYPEDGVFHYIRMVLIPGQGKEHWVWGIFLKSKPNELIGAISLQREGAPGNIGFWLGKPYWGQGIMSEAMKPVLDHVFTRCGFERVIICNAAGNMRSRRVSEKLGAKLLRTEPAEYVNPEYKEREVWELTALFRK